MHGRRHSSTILHVCMVDPAVFLGTPNHERALRQERKDDRPINDSTERPAMYLMARLILHQQPLATRAHSIALAQITRILLQVLCRGTPPYH